MAIDKAVDSTVLNGYFTDIANAIRGKNGESGTYTPAEMPAKIAAIQTGDPRLARIVKGDANPLDISDLNIDTIRDYAFAGASFQSIDLPPSVNMIRIYAFYQTPSLRTVTMPTAPIDIMSNAFANSGITSITLPDIITESIWNQAQNLFKNCSNLRTASLPSNVTQLPDSLFEGCSNLLSVAFPSNLTLVGARAFYGCTRLPLTGLPDTITEIATSAFERCSALALTTLPASLTTLRGSALANCSALAITELPATLTLVENAAFQSSGITELDVKCALGNHYMIFSQCTSLQKLKIRGADFGTMTTNRNCDRCTSLQHVWISQDCQTITANNSSNAPFSGCSALTDIYCEAASQPSGWSQYWNYKTTYGQATVHWGVSESDFDAIVSGS